jgi:hypothetical protein
LIQYSPYFTWSTHQALHISASAGIRTHDPNVRAGEDCSCLRMRGHCGRPVNLLIAINLQYVDMALRLQWVVPCHSLLSNFCSWYNFVKLHRALTAARCEFFSVIYVEYDKIV